MPAILKYCENSIKHLVKAFGKVGCQESQHKISVLLKQRVFVPIAPVSVGVP